MPAPSSGHHASVLRVDDALSLRPPSHCSYPDNRLGCGWHPARPGRPGRGRICDLPAIGFCGNLCHVRGNGACRALGGSRVPAVRYAACHGDRCRHHGLGPVPARPVCEPRHVLDELGVDGTCRRDVPHNVCLCLYCRICSGQGAQPDWNADAGDRTGRQYLLADHHVPRSRAGMARRCLHLRRHHAHGCLPAGVFWPAGHRWSGSAHGETGQREKRAGFYLSGHRHRLEQLCHLRHRCSWHTAFAGDGNGACRRRCGRLPARCFQGWRARH
ncbi:hypothetical protein D3C71_1348570 [compost metagenome]